MMREPDIIDKKGMRWWIVVETHDGHVCEHGPERHYIARGDTFYFSFFGAERCLHHPPISYQKVALS